MSIHRNRSLLLTRTDCKDRIKQDNLVNIIQLNEGRSVTYRL